MLNFLKGSKKTTAQPDSQTDYQARLTAESNQWGQHYLTQARPWNAWLEHPLIGQNYARHMFIADENWTDYLKRVLGGPARRSLDLGCSSGYRSLDLFKVGCTQHLEGVDISPELVMEAEKQRTALHAPGQFWATDVNTISLAPNTYDLIFSCHAFHHFLALEHIMEQVVQALTPGGIFLLEEYVGPTQFQWTERQTEFVRLLLNLLPDRLCLFRTGQRKQTEVTLAPEVLEAASPFEAIRSAEIAPLFTRYFKVQVAQSLGGTLQHLLYNGIIHNFDPADAEANHYLETIIQMEDMLIADGFLPADFMLLIGTRL